MLLAEKLLINKCPFCGMSQPDLRLENMFESFDNDARYQRLWGVYVCEKCGGVVTAGTYLLKSRKVTEIYPQSKIADQSLPSDIRQLWQTALDNLRDPEKSINCILKVIKSMLSDQDLTTGSILERLNQAEKKHLFSKELLEWAYEINCLEDCDQKRKKNYLPSEEKNLVNFTLALAEFLYILPAKIRQG